MKKEIEFWVWFSSIAIKLAEDYENEIILDEIDDKVTNLGEDLSWEVGPGKKEINSFTISPNGDQDLMKKTREIISSAPKIPNWEFHYSKQPKEWDLIFELQTKFKSVTINAANWKYVLFEFPDKTFDIQIEAADLLQLDEANREYAVEIVLDGVIGEEQRILTIGDIEIVSNADQYKSKQSSFINLKGHLLSLI